MSCSKKNPRTGMPRPWGTANHCFRWNQTLRLSLGFGVSSRARRIQAIIRHEQTGLLIAPREGMVYGRKGRQIGSVCRDGYVRLGGCRSGYLYAHRVIWETLNGPIPP